ncbi:threonine dehydratase [Pseudaestuariivita sp.]|uniref:threonine dehydratase n=1 Tax=Pseudaestuariivita sp. TaxID=2211669 RepID=UPI004058181E
MIALRDLERAHALVQTVVPPTPARNWPLLSRQLGTDLIVKHENHAPTGAFKVRGGVTFMRWLKDAHPDVRGIVTATRGNHGQSQALAATQAGLACKVFVPRGNSVEKNAAMAAFGAELVEHGDDFDEARIEAHRVAEAEGLYFVPSFHPQLVAGVGTYGLELFEAHPDLDVVYVPIGLGSGICGTIAARDAVGAKAEIVGVVAENANAAKLSVEAGRVVETNAARSFADGMAVRVPSAEAFAIYRTGASRIAEVSEDEVAAAMRILFETTHNVAEGAGAAALAAALKDKEALASKKVAVILSGGNVDTDVFRTVLGGVTPQV